MLAPLGAIKRMPPIIIKQDWDHAPCSCHLLTTQARPSIYDAFTRRPLVAIHVYSSYSVYLFGMRFRLVFVLYGKMTTPAHRSPTGRCFFRLYDTFGVGLLMCTIVRRCAAPAFLLLEERLAWTGGRSWCPGWWWQGAACHYNFCPGHSCPSSLQWRETNLLQRVLLAPVFLWSFH